MMKSTKWNINMNKLEYRNKATNVISRNYDPYISPYNLPDPEAEKYFRTDLIKIMSASMESIASTGFTIERLPKGTLRQVTIIIGWSSYYSWYIVISDYLEKILILEAPKKIIQYVPSSSSNNIGTEITDVNKPKQARKPGPRGGKQQRSALLRSLPDVASIYAEEGHSRFSASEDYYKSKATSSIGHKRSHIESTGTIATGSREKASSSSSAISPDQKPPIPKDKLPGNFYKVANELFDEFWAMEFDDVEITWAFFAKINFLNCKDYHLDDFAEESYSLAIIKVCLKFDKSYAMLMWMNVYMDGLILMIIHD